jgi:hypothetical protein
MPDPIPALAVADGGVSRVNPSPVAGTWAYRLVAADGSVLREGSGYCRPAFFGTPTVENNVTEFLALLIACEQLPAGWAGTVGSDSGNTIRRFRDPRAAKMNGVPDFLRARLVACRDRLGALDFVLFGGHPSRKELAAGFRKDGKPVNAHQHWCHLAVDRRNKEAETAEDKLPARFGGEARGIDAPNPPPAGAEFGPRLWEPPPA